VPKSNFHEFRSAGCRRNQDNRDSQQESENFSHSSPGGYGMDIRPGRIACPFVTSDEILFQIHPSDRFEPFQSNGGGAYFS
jgi:hypothetical protein